MTARPVDAAVAAAEAPLAAGLADARRRTLALAAALREEELLGPRLDIVNPPLWELGHVAWFQERWVLRHAAGRAPLRAGVDALYDSSAVAHDRRWELPLPDLAATLDYLRRVQEDVLSLVSRGAADRYFVELSVLHEDMHAEAMAFTRHTLGLARPSGYEDAAAGGAEGDLAGDVAVPGGTFLLGASPGEPFVFDNEKWAHPVHLEPFRIARAPVTQARLREFVEDGGYRRRELWSDAGWAWREAAEAERPSGWERRGAAWFRRVFDAWEPLHPHRPAVNVCWFEAEAWCRWAGRRLPSEAEWEAAALAAPAADGGLGATKRRFPWGDEPPGPARARLGALEPVDVAALPGGDSPFGCRQMIGNAWEWTGSDFVPYPGFVVDPYRDYSQPWFGTHKVLRGGSFATPARVARGTFRNFYTPGRRDPWAGFRTCAA